MIYVYAMVFVIPLLRFLMIIICFGTALYNIWKEIKLKKDSKNAKAYVEVELNFIERKI